MAQWLAGDPSCPLLHGIACKCADLEAVAFLAYTEARAHVLVSVCGVTFGNVSVYDYKPNVNRRHEDAAVQLT